MRSHRMTTLLLACVMAVVLVAPSARAARPATTLDLRWEDGILWSEAVLGRGEATSVRITFWAPTDAASGRRVLWQVCRFAFDGAGMYRCGIDASAGSAARGRSGEWVTRVAIDGLVVARRTFRL